MKQYRSTIDWVALAADNDEASTICGLIHVLGDGTVLESTDRIRIHRASRSDRYPFVDGAWNLKTGELVRNGDSAYQYPDTSGLFVKEGEGYELFASDAKAVVVAAEAAAKAKSIPALALLPCSDGETVALNALYLAEALSGAFRGKGLFAPVTFWAAKNNGPVELEIDWSQGDVAEWRRAVIMPVSPSALETGPTITVDLASYVDVRQPVLV